MLLLACTVEKPVTLDYVARDTARDTGTDSAVVQDTACVPAEEACDGLDNDCDGVVDEGVGVVRYTDVDGDGWGDPHSGASTCDAAAGVATGLDCDDADAAVSPSATEACNGVDDDCDGVTDEDTEIGTWYADDDGDGFGDPGTATEACDAPAGHVSDASDCDDTDPATQHCASCQEVLDRGASSGDGVYSLDPCGTGASDHWCDMTTDGGGWTVAGWQDAAATTTLGVSDWGVVGDAAWSVNLDCLPYDEIQVFNLDLADWHSQVYDPAYWSSTATNFAIGDVPYAFKHGTYGPSDSQIMMGCVDYSFGGSLETQYACDTDWGSGVRGHLADYAGEFCGDRLDTTWAWSDGAACTSRGVSYTWGYAIRGYAWGGNED